MTASTYAAKVTEIIDQQGGDYEYPGSFESDCQACMQQQLTPEQAAEKLVTEYFRADYRGLVEQRAKETAAMFVEEFAEALDPAATDWDSTAWGEDSRGLPSEAKDDLWPIYQAALVAETERLVGRIVT